MYANRTPLALNGPPSALASTATKPAPCDGETHSTVKAPDARDATGPVVPKRSATMAIAMGLDPESEGGSSADRDTTIPPDDGPSDGERERTSGVSTSSGGTADTLDAAGNGKAASG